MVCGWSQTRTILAILAAVTVTFAPAAAFAQDASRKRACIDANEQGQIAQQAGRLLQARELFVSCASKTCPSVVLTDCARLLADVTASLSSVVIVARDGSDEIAQVRMLVDGVPVAASITGVEIPVDPGPHTIRLEAGGRVKEKKVVVPAGEKRVRLEVDFAEPEPAAERLKQPEPAAERPTPPIAHSAPPAAPSAPSRSPARSSVIPWVLGGVAVAGAASFGIVAGIGYAGEKHLASTCAPYCSNATVAIVHTDYHVADASLGVAIVSLGAAVVVWLAERHATTTAGWRLDAGPLTAGRAAAILTW